MMPPEKETISIKSREDTNHFELPISFFITVKVATQGIKSMRIIRNESADG